MGGTVTLEIRPRLEGIGVGMILSAASGGSIRSINNWKVVTTMSSTERYLASSA